MRASKSDGSRAKGVSVPYFDLKKLSTFGVESAKFGVSTFFDFALMPPIILKECYKIALSNFGVALDKWVNDFCLVTILATTLSNLWVNPYFDTAHKDLEEILYKIDEIESDDEFYAQWNDILHRFVYAVLVYVINSNINSYADALLNSRIAALDQEKFINEYLKKAAYYGVTLFKSEDGEDAAYKNNINPEILYSDFKVKNQVLSLFFSRIDTFVDLYTAYHALKGMSAVFYTVGIGYFTLNVPHLFAMAFTYAFVYTIASSMLERPIERLQKEVRHLGDSITRKFSTVGHNPEEIAFLNGGSFEKDSLLATHRELIDAENKERNRSTVKGAIQSFINNFNWVMPIMSSIDAVRQKHIKREELFVAMNNYGRVRNYFAWAKGAFGSLSYIKESLRRIDLFEQRLKAWEAESTKIEAKFDDSANVSFSGSIYHSDEMSEDVLLAKGTLSLESGKKYYFDALSGSGKTTLFRVLSRIWPHFEGSGSLPKEQTVFAPSRVYILGSDEPLLQSVAYPQNHSEVGDADVATVKTWMAKLNLKEKHIDALEQVKSQATDAKKEQQSANWLYSLSDGERKRIAFLNILLKLKTQDVKFLILDEPFKGVDPATQAEMVALLSENLADDCTVLFSNHEGNHGLDTHVISINQDKVFEVKENKKGTSGKAEA